MKFSSRRRPGLRGVRVATTSALLTAALLLVSGPAGIHPVHASTVGAVEAWGYDYYDQLGYGLPALPIVPYPQAIIGVPQASPLNGQTGVSGVAGGGSHSLAVKSGNVLGWGRDYEGQLGDGSSGGANLRKATAVKAEIAANTPLTGVTAVAAGTTHSLALTSGGNVYAFGSNVFGELGNGTTTPSSFAVEVMKDSTHALTGITAIAAAGFHSLALDSSGNVWSWGSNSNGQLGNNSLTDSSFAIEVEATSTPTFLSGVTDIAAGYTHSLVVKNDGSVWGWGLDASGQLGDNTLGDTSGSPPCNCRKLPVQAQDSAGGNVATGTTTGLAWPLQRVSAGDSHSLVLKSNGSVLAWGGDIDAQLGDNTFGDTSGSPPCNCREKAVAALTTNPTGGPTALTGVQSVAGGATFSLALMSDGSARSWGDDGLGQLGDGTYGDLSGSSPGPPPTLACECRKSAVTVLGIAKAVDIAAGAGHGLAVVGP